MLVDIHTHLLPGVDDGPPTLDLALDLARQAAQEGVTHAVVTPHHFNGRYVNSAEAVRQACRELQGHYQEAGIPLTLSPGQEIRLTDEIMEAYYAGQLLSLDQEGQGLYYLIEFPTRRLPDETEDLLEAMLYAGMTPVIAHPERNHVLAKDYHLLAHFIEMGCLAQVTTSSYTGFYGAELQTISREMIDYRLVHVLASDVHHLTQRPVLLAEAYDLLEKEFGLSKRHTFQSNAQAIYQGQKLAPPRPEVPDLTWWTKFWQKIKKK